MRSTRNSIISCADCKQEISENIYKESLNNIFIDIMMDENKLVSVFAKHLKNIVFHEKPVKIKFGESAYHME